MEAWKAPLIETDYSRQQLTQTQEKAGGFGCDALLVASNGSVNEIVVVSDRCFFEEETADNRIGIEEVVICGSELIS